MTKSPWERVEKRLENEFRLVMLFDETGKKNRFKVVLPDIVSTQWEFTNEREEQAFVKHMAAISGEYINSGVPKDETAKRMQTLVERTVAAGLIRKVDA